MLTMLRYDGEVWEIGLGHRTDENSVNVRKVVPGRDDKAIAAGITHIQSDGRYYKSLAAHEIRRIR